MLSFFTIAKVFLGWFTKNVLGRWQVLLAVCIICISSIVLLKIKSLESSLAKANNTIELEQKNNKTLRDNINVLQGVNQTNQQMIDQLLNDKKIASDSIKALSGELIKTTKSINEIRSQLDDIKTTPIAISPFIAKVISEIQLQREQHE